MEHNQLFEVGTQLRNFIVGIMESHVLSGMDLEGVNYNDVLVTRVMTSSGDRMAIIAEPVGIEDGISGEQNPKRFTVECQYRNLMPDTRTYPTGHPHPRPSMTFLGQLSKRAGDMGHVAAHKAMLATTQEEVSEYYRVVEFATHVQKLCSLVMEMTALGPGV